MTVGEYFRRTVARFKRARLHFGHGTDNAHDEAAWLMLHVLRLPFGSLPGKQVLTKQQQMKLEHLVEQRIQKRVPVAYLTRQAWLEGLSFHIDRRALIPRSHIATLLRDRLRPWLRAPVRRALDLCTGSACLAILLARAFPKARVDASDVSKPALTVARKNVAAYRLGKRLELVESNLFSNLKGRKYDLIVCNPPYVTRRAMRALPREYRHEPVRALVGGDDGLALVRRIIEQAAAHLSDRGLLVCEVGDGRAPLERAYPQLEFLWPPSESAPDPVFVLPLAGLPIRARKLRRPRTRSRRLAG